MINNLTSQISKLSDKEVNLLLKASLEFNASIILLATSYAGKLDTLRDRQRFAMEHKRQIDLYEKFCKDLIYPEIEPDNV